MGYSEASPSLFLERGEYDIQQTSSSARQRMPGGQGQTRGRFATKGSNPDRKKLGLKLGVFAAGIITGYGAGVVLKFAGFASGKLLLGVSLGLSAGSYVVGKNIAGAPGTFSYGVSFGASLFSSYEGWSILRELDQAREVATIAARSAVPGLASTEAAAVVGNRARYAALAVIRKFWQITGIAP